MDCPYCDGDTRVVDSRAVDDAIRRRRECQDCAHRFTTYERVAELEPAVVKRDGRREPFQREKVLHGLRLACVKRPVPEAALEQIVDAVRTRAVQDGHAEVSSLQVGEWVLERLRPVDAVAAFRFASVLHNPPDLGGLETELARADAPPAREPDGTQPSLPGMDGRPRGGRSARSAAAEAVRAAESS